MQDSLGVDNAAFMQESLTDKDVSDDLEYKDEGYIELVLKVLAQMCDGQFTGLQVSLLEEESVVSIPKKVQNQSNFVVVLSCRTT